MLVIANILFQERQEMMLHMDITKWSVLKSDSLYSLQLKIEKLYAAAAKSLQSCPTLCDPIDGSPTGSSIPGILQARTREWVAISFSNAWKWKVKGKSLSRVQLCATPWTVAYQALPSMGFSRQEYWSGVPLPSPKSSIQLTKQNLVTAAMKLKDTCSLERKNRQTWTEY